MKHFVHNLRQWSSVVLERHVKLDRASRTRYTGLYIFTPDKRELLISHLVHVHITLC